MLSFYSKMLAGYTPQTIKKARLVYKAGFEFIIWNFQLIRICNHLTHFRHHAFQQSFDTGF